MTSLEALKFIYDLEDIQGGRDEFWEAYRIIEKDLKALDIIRNKKVIYIHLLKKSKELKEYNNSIISSEELTEEEWKLLKEQLNEPLLMRYVRTEYQITDLNVCCFDYNDKIIKQANTIEELCDEFVRVREDINDFLVSDDIPTQTEGWTIYGAIWIKMGLLFVAKLNEKGEFELL